MCLLKACVAACSEEVFKRFKIAIFVGLFEGYMKEVKRIVLYMFRFSEGFRGLPAWPLRT